MNRPDATSIFDPGALGPIRLRNRVIKSATFEGMCENSGPTEALIAFHQQIAAGGVGMSTLAYCAVHPDGRTFEQQMYMRGEILPDLRRLTDAIHAEGSAASVQLGHCGGFSRNKRLQRRRPAGPSFGLNTYGLMSGMPFSAGMTANDIEQTVDAFVVSAQLAGESGFDAVELHLGHGYLLSQFLSPACNTRSDQWGGSLENRFRFARDVVRRVHDAVGERMAVITKLNLRDGFRGGMELEESVEVGKMLEREGVSGIVLTGGFTSKTPFYLFRGDSPLKEMIANERNALQRITLWLVGDKVIRSYPFEETFFLDQAREMRKAVSIPLVLLGGVVSHANMQTAMDEGFDFVALGRALIADPTLVEDFRSGAKTRTRCTACNKCVAEIDAPGGVRCVLD